MNEKHKCIEDLNGFCYICYKDMLKEEKMDLKKLKEENERLNNRNRTQKVLCMLKGIQMTIEAIDEYVDLDENSSCSDETKLWKEIKELIGLK